MSIQDHKCQFFCSRPLNNCLGNRNMRKIGNTKKLNTNRRLRLNPWDGGILSRELALLSYKKLLCYLVSIPQ